jgi:death-on-curing protein
MEEPVFLDFAVIEELHRASLDAYGGSPGIRDQGLIESALGSAMNAHFYGNGDLFDVAAAYAFHLAQAQAYLDGNKRTGAGAALLFLRGNGVRRVPKDAEIYDAMIAIAERRLDKSGLAEMFRRAAVSLP